MAMIAQNAPNKQSRRNWLRDAAIAATSAVLVPSMLVSCSDHRIPPSVGIGAPQDVPLTQAELAMAAQNLVHMVDWLRDLHISQTDYEIKVLEWLKSGTDKPSGWSDFIINILLDIAVGVITAAAEAATAGAATAVLAITSELIKKFAFSENRPHDLDGAFVEFKDGQDKLYEAIKNTLLILADEGHPSDKDYPYQNLKEKFKGGAVDFNGKQYTLRDLAGSHFPTEADGTAYVVLFTAAYDKFKRNIWNVMFIKAGSLSYSAAWSETWEVLIRSPTYYGRNTHYKDYPATYLRGWYLGGLYYFRYWYFTFDGRELPAAAAKELFKDDTPNHIINPDGLFNRDYVFKQFRREKPDFFGYHELKKNPNDWAQFSNEEDFDLPDDFEFTGGDFPQLIKK